MKAVVAGELWAKLHTLGAGILVIQAYLGASVPLNIISEVK